MPLSSAPPTGYIQADNWLRSVCISSDYAMCELQHYIRRRNDGAPSIMFADRMVNKEQRHQTPQSASWAYTLIISSTLHTASNQPQPGANMQSVTARQIKPLANVHKASSESASYLCSIQEPPPPHNAIEIQPSLDNPSCRAPDLAEHERCGIRFNELSPNNQPHPPTAPRLMAREKDTD
ncbi:hypothetical protein CPC08DRAFT_814391 [Agrocybe pediades]|nr:hypothetical protein CPC08DRAFT_814391 [Agrocybe pediades]